MGRNCITKQIMRFKKSIDFYYELVSSLSSLLKNQYVCILTTHNFQYKDLIHKLQTSLASYKSEVLYPVKIHLWVCEFPY